MRIGIWGALAYDNFGDDLMCWMLSEHLRSHSHSIVLNDASNELAATCAAELVTEMTTFVRSVDAIVICGGAFLAPIAGEPHPTSPSAKLGRLIERCEIDSVPIIAISVGGDGSGALHHDFQKRLLGSKQLRGVSLRLGSELGAGKFCSSAKVEHFPDIVLRAAAMIPADAREGSTGWNISSRKRLASIAVGSVRHMRHGQVLLSVSVRRGNRADVAPRWLGPQAPYNDPVDFCRAISRCDLILSSKLHVGVTALAYGRSFVSLRGRAKTAAFLREAQMDRAYLVHPEVDLIRHSTSELRDLGRPSEHLVAQVEQAAQHFTFLDELLEHA